MGNGQSGLPGSSSPRSASFGCVCACWRGEGDSLSYGRGCEASASVRATLEFVRGNKVARTGSASLRLGVDRITIVEGDPRQPAFGGRFNLVDLKGMVLRGDNTLAG